MIVFIILNIGVSEFSVTFSQLFSLMCKEGMVYDFVIKLLYFLIAITSLSYIVFARLKEPNYFIKSLLATLIGFFFLFVWIFSISSPQKDFIEELHSVSSNLAYLDFFSLIGIRFEAILISGFFYLFFCILPFGFWILNLSFDLTKLLGRFAYIFFPSIYICLIVLVASAFQPYYNKPNLYLYVDLLVFVVAILLLLIIFIRKKNLFKFYEYVNLLLLVAVMLAVLLCSDVLSNTDYFNVRFGLYLYAFLMWCSEWMFVRRT